MVEKEQIIEVLKKVYDPEIQYDIWSLGLVYNIDVQGSKVRILMTFTSPMCPYGPVLLDDVRRQVSAIDGVGEVEVEITFSPAWSPDKMSEEAKIGLGITG
ncbi:MAG: metal-sulfur cluster assembly factor [Nanoarchaeota archaeon]|nr:metal-sulfur cluster assembly factor [Nanoarchaeota archaeon]